MAVLLGSQLHSLGPAAAEEPAPGVAGALGVTGRAWICSLCCVGLRGVVAGWGWEKARLWGRAQQLRYRHVPTILPAFFTTHSHFLSALSSLSG